MPLINLIQIAAAEVVVILVIVNVAVTYRIEKARDTRRKSR